MTEYRYDKKAAERAVSFFPDCIQHVKGSMAGKPFHLEPWQQAMIREIFGWKRQDGSRRYRKIYCEIPRKNGKSTFAAGVALYLLLCDKEYGAEIYSAASTRDQAALVYGMAASMLRGSPELIKHVSIRDSVKRILHKKSDSFYRAISADAEGAHGFNAHGIIFDEVHTQQTRDLWDVLDTSTGARSQPLTLAITTAGYDRSSICWELHQYAKGVQDGSIVDDSFLPVLYSAELEDDWRSEETWKKANPCLGVAVTLDYLTEQCKRAEENPAFENTFRRLHLNQWTEQEKRVIPMISWDKCKREFSEADMYGRPCFGGLDLSSTRDATAFVLVFPEPAGGFKVLPHFWIPKENVDRQAGADKRQLQNYAMQGHIELTDGNEIDVFYLASRIYEICQQYDVQYVGYDPWNSTGVIQAMISNGLPENVLMKMPQSFSTYNEPFKRLLASVENQKFEHNGNNVLRWMAGNVASKEDPSGNIRPDKGKSADKIDGICAMLMGLALSIAYSATERAYATEGSGVILF